MRRNIELKQKRSVVKEGNRHLKCRCRTLVKICEDHKDLEDWRDLRCSVEAKEWKEKRKIFHWDVAQRGDRALVL